MSYTPTVWETGDIITAQKLNKMENAMLAVLSDYESTNWVDGDIITAEKLNKLENAIAYVNFDYIKTTWKNDDIITASLLNNMENGIETASVDKTWDEMDWNDIIVATRTGKYNTFNVGDMKEMDLGTEGIVHMQIVGIDVDELADGSGYSPLTFISKELLETSHRMNPARTPSSAPYDEGTGSIGGWDKSEMKQYILNTVISNLPEVIRNNVKTVKKYTRIYNTAGDAVNDVETDETFWLASSREIFGAVSMAETKGLIYSEAFPDNASRIKQKVGWTSASMWWLRSAGSTKAFTVINPDGSHGSSNASYSYDVALGFCL